MRRETNGKTKIYALGLALMLIAAPAMPAAAMVPAAAGVNPAAVPVKAEGLKEETTKAVASGTTAKAAAAVKTEAQKPL